MKSKRIIIIFLIIIIFALAVVLTSVLFRVGNFEVNYNTDPILNINKNLVESSLTEFKGKNILFLDEKSIANKVETDFPYVKVVNIERKFPKTVRIEIQERIEVYFFRIGENCVYTDYTCKILDISENERDYDSKYGQVIEVKIDEKWISNYDYDNVENNKGKILEFRTYGATKFLTGLYLNTTDDPIFFRKYIASVDISGFFGTIGVSPTADIIMRTGAKFAFWEPSKYGEEFISIMNGLMGVNSEPPILKQIDRITGNYVIRYKDGEPTIEGKPFYD